MSGAPILSASRAPAVRPWRCNAPRTALAFSTIALVACGAPGPKQVYVGMTTSAEFGDTKGFLAAFTKESQQLVQSQVSLSEAYGLKNDNPVSLLVFPAVDDVEVNGDQAIISVSKGSAKRRILMIKNEDGWRIDTKQLAEFWEAEKKRK